MPFLTRDGVRLRYVDSGRGAVTLLFIHGGAGDIEQWDGQAKAFGRDYRVVRIDLRGHGRSDAPLDGPYTIESFADDTYWMIRQLKLDRPVVIGHSLGGAVAARLAVQHPRAVRGVVLADPQISRRMKLAVRRNRREHPLPPGVDGLAVQFRPGFDQATIDRIIARTSKTPAHVRGGGAVWVHDIDEAVRRLSELRIPAMYIGGDSSPGREPSEARRALEGTCIWIGTVVASGHYVFIEAAEQFNAMLRRFLAELARPRARGRAPVATRA